MHKEKNELLQGKYDALSLRQKQCLEKISGLYDTIRIKD